MTTATTFDNRTTMPLGDRLSIVFSDSVTIAKRNVIKIKRVPDVLIFSTLSPIMFVLLFAYIFGSAIEVPGMSGGYREFLIAGIFAQSVVFGATFTGLGLAEDMQKGIIDRFRSLPMAPSAVMVGRTLSDVVINVVSLVVMSLTGLLVGWRIRGSFLDAVLAYVLLLLFAYAVSWIMAVVGLLVRAPEVFNNASFMVIFPLTFLANTFVPLENLPMAARVRRMEPGVRGDSGDPRVVRQHQLDGAEIGCLVDAASGGDDTGLGGDHPAGVHSAGAASVQADREPLSWAVNPNCRLATVFHAGLRQRGRRGTIAGVTDSRRGRGRLRGLRPIAAYHPRHTTRQGDEGRGEEPVTSTCGYVKAPQGHSTTLAHTGASRSRCSSGGPLGPVPGEAGRPWHDGRRDLTESDRRGDAAHQPR
jgi:ABC-2 type transport system permease protein